MIGYLVAALFATAFVVSALSLASGLRSQMHRFRELTDRGGDA